MPGSGTWRTADTCPRLAPLRPYNVQASCPLPSAVVWLLYTTVYTLVYGPYVCPRLVALMVPEHRIRDHVPSVSPQDLASSVRSYPHSPQGWCVIGVCAAVWFCCRLLGSYVAVFLL